MRQRYKHLNHCQRSLHGSSGLEDDIILQDSPDVYLTLSYELLPEHNQQGAERQDDSAKSKITHGLLGPLPSGKHHWGMQDVCHTHRRNHRTIKTETNHIEK